MAAPAAYAGTLMGFALVPALGRASLPSLPSLPSLRAAADLLLAVAAVGIPVAYGAAFVAGAPLYLLLRQFGVLGRWTLWLSGGSIGVVVAWALAPRLRGDLFSIPFPWWAGLLLGVVSAEAFWRLLTGVRPPRHSPTVERER